MPNPYEPSPKIVKRLYGVAKAYRRLADAVKPTDESRGETTPIPGFEDQPPFPTVTPFEDVPPGGEVFAERIAREHVLTWELSPFGTPFSEQFVKVTCRGCGWTRISYETVQKISSGKWVDSMRTLHGAEVARHQLIDDVSESSDASESSDVSDSSDASPKTLESIEEAAERIAKTHVIELNWSSDPVPNTRIMSVVCHACGWRREAPATRSHDVVWYDQMQRVHAAYVALSEVSK